MNSISSIRNSFMEFGKIYFWTATIRNWNKLLLDDTFKNIIVDSLNYLHSKNLVEVFGFVIMPNHVHFIWRINQLNGKERPQGSFLKFTAHEFKKLLEPSELRMYKVEAADKEYEFWQRDPLAIELYSPNVAYQKLDYIHLNPLAKGWNLATDPNDYTYSSSSFYENEDQRFQFLKHLGDEL